VSAWKDCGRELVLVVFLVAVGPLWDMAAGDDLRVALVVPGGEPATIDGSLAEGEWADAVAISTDGVLTLYAKHADGMLYIGVTVPERSVANVLIATPDRVRILHSSAALGTAVYRQESDLWRLETDFVWRCRGAGESPKADAERALFLETEGWLASTAFMGTPGELEYEIQWAAEFTGIAVLVAPVSNPEAVSIWPAGAAQNALPGPIPSDASFGVETWATISWQTESGVIAFSSVRDENSDVYTISADGSDLRRVTKTIAEELEPSWSPGGDHFAYQSRRPAWSLYTSLVDGTGEQALGTSLSWSPAWSPDGSRIAYSTGSSIRCVSVANGEMDVLVPSCGDCGRPSWSPDGTELVFHSSVAGSMDVYVLDVESGAKRQLTDEPSRDFLATWSPDGIRLAFTSDREGNLEIYTMAADGTSVTRITDDPAVDMLPAWSPSGEWIAFVSERDGNREIYIMRPDGFCVRRLTENPGDDMYPAWKPE